MDTAVSRRRTGFLALVICGLAVGAALLAGLLVLGGGTAPDAVRPPEIRRLIPDAGDLILSQGEVGADVPQGWTFRLSIDGTAIPDDQLESIPQLGQYRFKPRPGRVISRLDRGEHTARVEIEPVAGGEKVAYSWSFRVGP